MNIGFLGLGKLGLPCALAVESKGHRVLGYDTSEAVRGYVRDRAIPYLEEGAQALLDVTKLEMVGFLDLVEQSDIIFVAVQTPHDAAFEGVTRMPFRRVEFDYGYLSSAIGSIRGAAYRLGKEPIVAIISTVLPGTMEREIIEEREECLKICYNPFFIAMGTAIRDFLNPEFVLLGVDDDDAAETVRGFYQTITDAPVRRMSVASAECVKVFYNTFITAKITFTNAIGRMCHETPGANCDDVMKALQAAMRRIISPAYMNVGMGDGGGCHPRDNIALSAVCRRREWGYDPWNDLMTWRDGYHEWLAWLIVETGLPCIVLGMTFKPETNLLIGSPARLVVDALQRLTSSAQPMDWYDPNFDAFEVPKFTEPRCFFIGCKHPEFALMRFPAGSVVIDPHRYMPDQDGVRVIRIGENGPSYNGG